MDADERLASIDRVNRTPTYLRKPKARDLGQRLNLTSKQRDALGVRTIAAVDMTDEQVMERRKAKDRERKRRARQSREAYLAIVASSQPWKAYGIGKRQYYRRKKAGILMTQSVRNKAS